MELSILFMITCVITARIFVKKKMKIAAIAYTVMFVTVLFILIFATDLPIVVRALKNMIGVQKYTEIHSVMSDAIRTTWYGISILTVIGAIIVVQMIAAIWETARAVAVYCFGKQALLCKFKRAFFRYAQLARNLYLPRRINLLYCRMLN